VIWAALRSGLYLTPINRFLNAEEAAYILADSEAKALVTSLALADTAAAALTHVSDCGLRLVVGGKADGFDNYDVALGRHPPTPLADQPRGEIMVYSSGTTGRPKGIKRPLSGRSIDTATPLTSVLQGLMGLSADTVYRSTAPLYHGARSGTAYCSGSRGDRGLPRALRPC
jgi:long-chain acyl-CoA synthetase